MGWGGVGGVGGGGIRRGGLLCAVGGSVGSSWLVQYEEQTEKELAGGRQQEGRIAVCGLGRGKWTGWWLQCEVQAERAEMCVGSRRGGVLCAFVGWQEEWLVAAAWGQQEGRVLCAVCG